nr:hypothetical protein [Tanacetum cinerariifolium]
MIPEPGDANRDINITETSHLQTDDELFDKEIKQIEADDQAIQSILLGLPEDIYAAVDSYETAQEIWLRVQQMVKGSDIGIQEKKAKLFNEWERFTSNEGESIESYYHCFLKLMNDLKRNKHFPKKIASNLKFLNNLQPEWSRHLTIVHQTKDLHTADYTQLYDFLKYNQKEVDELKAKRLAKIQDPLELMANSNNPYVFSAPRQDESSLNQNYLQQPMQNPKDITDPTTAMNKALALMAKAFKLNYSTPTTTIGEFHQTQGTGRLLNRNTGNSAGYNDVIGNQVIQNAVQNPRVQNVRNPNGLMGVQGNGNQNQIGNGNLVATRAKGNAAGQNGNQIRCYNCRGICYYARNYTAWPRRRDAAYLQTQLLIAQKEEAGIQLQAEEYDLMAAAANLDDIEEVNASCILMANLQQASTSEVHKNYDNNEIFNTFTQEEQYTELLEPIPELHQVPQNDNDVVSEVTGVVQGYQNPSYLKQAQKKQQSLYDGKMLLDKHDPPVVHDSKETLQLAQESRDKMKQMNKEIKPANYTKINHLSGEAAKFVGDFKSLAKEADDSLAKHKAMELDNERLLKAVVSQDVMNIVQKESVVDTSDLQTEFKRTKERFENCIIKKETEYAKLWNDWYKKCNECKYEKFRTIKLTRTCNKRSNGCKLIWEISRVNARILLVYLIPKISCLRNLRMQTWN